MVPEGFRMKRMLLALYSAVLCFGQRTSAGSHDVRVQWAVSEKQETIDGHRHIYHLRGQVEVRNTACVT
jgi:hypothetical protein